MVCFSFLCDCCVFVRVFVHVFVGVVCDLLCGDVWFGFVCVVFVSVPCVKHVLCVIDCVMLYVLFVCCSMPACVQCVCFVCGLMCDVVCFVLL